MPNYQPLKDMLKEAGGHPSEGPHLTSSDHIQIRGVLFHNGKTMGDYVPELAGDRSSRTAPVPPADGAPALPQAAQEEAPATTDNNTEGEEDAADAGDEGEEDEEGTAEGALNTDTDTDTEGEEA